MSRLSKDLPITLNQFKMSFLTVWLCVVWDFETINFQLIKIFSRNQLKHQNFTRIAHSLCYPLTVSVFNHFLFSFIVPFSCLRVGAGHTLCLVLESRGVLFERLGNVYACEGLTLKYHLKFVLIYQQNFFYNYHHRFQQLYFVWNLQTVFQSNQLFYLYLYHFLYYHLYYVWNLQTV